LFLLRLFWPKKESNKAENAIEPKPKRVSCCCVNSLLLFAQLLATKTKTKAATKFPSPDNRYDKHNHSLGKLLSMVFSFFISRSPDLLDQFVVTWVRLKNAVFEN